MWGIALLAVTGLITGFGIVGQSGDCSMGARGGARFLLVTSGLPPGQGWSSCQDFGFVLICISLALAVFAALPLFRTRPRVSASGVSPSGTRATTGPVSQIRPIAHDAEVPEFVPVQISAAPNAIRTDVGYGLRTPLAPTPDSRWRDIFRDAFQREAIDRGWLDSDVTFDESAVVVGASSTVSERLETVKAAIAVANNSMREDYERDLSEQRRLEAETKAWWDREKQLGQEDPTETDPSSQPGGAEFRKCICGQSVSVTRWSHHLETVHNYRPPAPR